MSQHVARITWTRADGAPFVDNRYSRGHEWSFDGGTTVPASASPSVVPSALCVVSAVDPEEALVASASSCHMLWFLFFAAKGGFVVDSYVDDAAGVIEKNAAGKLAMTRITLRPNVVWSGAKVPTADELEKLHHASHDACFIANSLHTDVVVEPPAN